MKLRGSWHGSLANRRHIAWGITLGRMRTDGLSSNRAPYRSTPARRGRRKHIPAGLAAVFARLPTVSRRPIVAAYKAPKLFGDHGTERQHRAPTGGPAVDPGDITTAT
jgi:hypothetical protein